MSGAGAASRRGEPEAPPRATYQDVLDAPAHRVAEIVDGTLYTQPRPAAPHALASSYLGDELVGPFGKGRGGPGGWWIIDEPELHLGEDILVPDLAGWRWERMSDYPDAAYFTLVPDWVCEVLSPLDAQARPARQASHLRPRRGRAPVAGGPGGPDAGGAGTARRAVGADCEREGRRSGLHSAPSMPSPSI